MRRCLALNKSLKTADKCAFFISDFIKEQATGGFLGNKTFVWVYFRRWINPHLVHAVITISNMSVWSIITRPSAGEQVWFLLEPWVVSVLWKPFSIREPVVVETWCNKFNRSLLHHEELQHGETWRVDVRLCDRGRSFHKTMTGLNEAGV